MSPLKKIFELPQIFESTQNIFVSEDGLVVWPQWWSFADVSQQGIDFSKKISKIKIFF